MGYQYSGAKFPQQKPKLNERQSIAASFIDILGQRAADEAHYKFLVDTCDKVIASMRESIRMGTAPENAQGVIKCSENARNDALKQLEKLADMDQISPRNDALDIIIKLLTIA